MKHLMLLLFLTAFSISAKCQLDRNYWLVGGAGSFYTYNEQSINTVTNMPISGKLTEINITGNVGYFLFDKFAVGIRPGINSIKSHGANSASVLTEVTKIYVGPFARYYFLNKEKLFNILVDGSYQFGSLANFGKGTTQSTSIMTGTELFFNNSVGIELLLGYLHQKNIKDETQNAYKHIKNGFYVSIGFQIHLIKD